MNTLHYINGKINETRQYEKILWMIAGFGLLTVATGFLTTNVTVFILGVLPLTCGALLTRYFESRRNKLVRLRKQITI